MNGKDQQREKLYGLLGDLPDRNRPVSAETLSSTEHNGYILEKLRLDLNGTEDVPAYFVKPKNSAGKIPAVLFCHSHGGQYLLGKNEMLLGNPSYLVEPEHAKSLTDNGYAALCIDYWLFGERAGASENDFFKETLWDGRVLWGMMVYDQLRALDYLCGRPDVDASRIGVTGLSMGSTMSWWLAALDERFKVCIDLCCMTDFHTLIEKNGLHGHGIYYYVPRLLKYFSSSDINALIAPRPHLSLNGVLDNLTPDEGLYIIDENMKKVYAKENAPDAWQMIRYPVGHVETPDMRVKEMEFFKKWL
ncbi:MAG: prolyl oligopeptidase family serine peptidase [Defluviitaleaceae bacterium]|nr:prolyl oligopeptidase family serine peptidase [Defluviitaleaceae bacterium]